MFSATTHEIAEYIAGSVKGAVEFITAMDPDNFSFDDLPNPADAPPAETASMAKHEYGSYKYDNTETASPGGRRQIAKPLQWCWDNVHKQLGTILQPLLHGQS